MTALLLLFLAMVQTEPVEVEPVTCWWRTSAPSIRVGEEVTVILTCSLLQTEAARAIVDESRLEPSVVPMPPFEVVGGSRAPDVTTASRRFVQVEYRLRAIAEHVFASDVALPPLEVPYRVESRVSAGESLAGRDLVYALPPLTLRVLSLVPDTAEDIREAPIPTMAEIDRIDSRATTLRALAGVASAIGLLVLALAGFSMLRRTRASRSGRVRSLTRTAILAGARRELIDIQDAARRSGWSSDLAGRALAAVRIVAASATGRAVTQRPTKPASVPEFEPANGEIVMRGRLGPAAAVFASVTGADSEDLKDALARFSAARYGPEPAFDARVDDAVTAVLARVERLLDESPWLERLWTR